MGKQLRALVKRAIPAGTVLISAATLPLLHASSAHALSVTLDPVGALDDTLHSLSPGKTRLSNDTGTRAANTRGNGAVKSRDTAPISVSNDASQPAPEKDRLTKEQAAAIKKAKPLPMVKSMDIQPLDRSQYHTEFTPTTVSTTRSEVRQAPPTALLQASDQGWRILGVVWYWWLVMATFGVAGAKGLRKIRRPEASKILAS